MDLVGLIKGVGLVGLVAIIFAESGLFFGFFLPGDSLLFTAGFLASQNFLPLPALLILCPIAAVLGDNVGYAFGRRVGRRLFQREDSRFFKKKYVLQAQAFYEKHGPITIVLARFMPFVRTFAPIVAGIGEMHYRRFLIYNLFGGCLWAIGVTLAGYFLGSVIPDVDKYLLPIIFLIVFVSVLPSAIHVLKDPEMRESLIDTGLRLLRIRKGPRPATHQETPTEAPVVAEPEKQTVAE
jgi:membrane-associated protein